MDLSKLKDIFVEETMEKLEELENGLLQLEKSSEDKELLNTIFRAAHTIKGSGGSLGFNDISRFTHRMEELLDLVRQDKLTPDKEMINTLLEATDMIKEMTENISTDSEFAFDRCGPLMTKMEGMKTISSQQSAVSTQLSAVSDQQAENNAARTEASSPEAQTYRVIFAPDRDIFMRGIDPSIIIEDLKDLGEITSINADIDAVPELHELNPETLYLKWDILLRTEKGLEDIKKIFEFVEEGSEIKILPVAVPAEKTPLLGKLLVEEGIVKPCDVKEALKTQKRLGDILVEQGKAAPEDIQKALEKQNTKKTDSFKSAVASSIRVDIGKLETLTNLVSEMVIIQSMFQQTLTTGGQGNSAAIAGNDENSGENRGRLSEKVDLLFSQLQRIGKDIQESAMSLRMLPVGEVFQRFARLVRELSASRNKNIELVITGEDTELDKGILEKITDPLVHLIRNSIDHGMETPEERLAAGKPPKGVIHLSAYQMGDSIYIDVADDGRGLNRRKIIDKAVSKGLINNVEGLTDSQVNNLIFLPGFSTADSVTDISGRGVGMDVVKKNIDALNGRVFIRTEQGKGTTMSIKLPLTLVIIDGLTVLVGDETFVIPLSSVVETIRPGRKDVSTLNEKGEVIDVRGEYIPLLRLYELLGISAWNENPWDAIVIVTVYEGRKYCLLIDDLLGQQQVVIKSLGTAVPKLSDIAGGTILGDGKVALVLDVPGLIEKTMQQAAVVG